ncbi:unnamed protein product, partial [Durusdinium trenchii]
FPDHSLHLAEDEEPLLRPWPKAVRKGKDLERLFKAPGRQSHCVSLAMCRCGKTCSRVSVGLGLLLTIAGIALLLVGAMSLTSISLNVSAGIDGTTSGMLAAPTDLNCPYIILIERTSACSDFQASATTTAGTLDTAVCGSEELPEDAPC